MRPRFARHRQKKTNKQTNKKHLYPYDSILYFFQRTFLNAASDEYARALFGLSSDDRQRRLLQSHARTFLVRPIVRRLTGSDNDPEERHHLW